MPTRSRPAAEWPDWQGEAAVVAATGPSCTAATLNKFEGRARLIAIKWAWQLAAASVDVVYGSDRRWWIEQDGLPAFSGLKLSGSAIPSKLFGNIGVVRVVRSEAVLLDVVGTVGCGSRHGGGHSGFHALNLAVQFGANPITLLGFDMSNGHPDTEIHKAALRRAIDQMAAIGVRIVFGT